MVNLLSVDWDFFFPEPWGALVENMPEQDKEYWRKRLFLMDWGHGESAMFLSTWMWHHRAEGFRMNDIPLPGLSGEEKDFWRRFRFSDDAKLFVAESHSQIVRDEIIGPAGVNIAKVVNYDAHHDCGYNHNYNDILEFGKAYCDTWGVWFDLWDIEIEVVYPRWKYGAFGCEPEDSMNVVCDRHFDSGKAREEIFDAVFVCRSGAWVPAWLDEEFSMFLERCPLEPAIDVGTYERDHWSDEENINRVQALLKAVEEGHLD